LVIGILRAPTAKHALQDNIETGAADLHRDHAAHVLQVHTKRAPVVGIRDALVAPRALPGSIVAAVVRHHPAPARRVPQASTKTL
jgi:hypothetical protein